MRILKHLGVISLLLSLCISCAEDILPIAVEGLELNLTTISMKVGDSKTLTVTFTPADAENQTVKWSSTNKAVASVEDGEITAHKAGETTISVTSEDGGFRASCTVTVTEEQNPDDGNNNDSGNEDDGALVAVESVDLNISELSMTVGESATLAATVNPDDAANKNVVWSSSDNNTASVDNGKVTANRAGTATITVTTEDGNFKAYCVVTVKENEPLTVPNNEIWYTTNDGRIATINESAFNTSVISNTYENEKGIIKFSDDIISIGYKAFCNCSNLTNIEMPSNIRELGSKAFSGCSNLTSIDVPEGCTSIRCSLFYNCSNLKDITIPQGVISIEHDSFYGCSSLTNIEIPEGVTSIGDAAFYKCSSLMNIEIPEGVTSIEEHTFYCCSSLTDICIPESVTSIGDGAFVGCSSLTNIEIPEGVTSIEWDVFNGCSSLTDIRIPEGVTSIGGYAFSGCSSLTSIEIPENVASIGDGVFWGCSSLTSIDIPGGVSSIGYFAFCRCSSLTSIKLPVNALLNMSLSVMFGEPGAPGVNCPIEHLTISGAGELPLYACEDCDKLKSVIIGEGITSIGEGVFLGCSSLTELYLKPIMPPVIVGDFYFDINSIPNIYVPSTSVDAYMAAPGWNGYAYKIVGYDYY